ncbi:phosphoglycerate mutase [Bombiscardovia apis]|uniref:Phosphoglycerate mutase n=1 Tax=Bombiscardovia apis TaxID=2932182 RepID=A0ABN6SHI8_9BIFI|nr:histidine phosphatase family protein [Bombiscardovia apis]BDR54723.1 phosphoglycerate mutase [Bombiscardovia apis]
MSGNAQAVVQNSKKYAYLLLLMRHAAAKPGEYNGDRERVLSMEGLDQAERIGATLSQLSLIPDRIVCSGSARTRQTLDQMLDLFGDDPHVDYRESLYSDGTQAVFDQLAVTKANEHTLLIVAHEPAMSMGAQLLSDIHTDAKLMRKLNLGLSPANVAILASDHPFGEWNMHGSQLLGILNPKDMVEP